MPMITGREACDMNFQIKAVEEKAKDQAPAPAAA